jgi:hypothetical protein
MIFSIWSRWLQALKLYQLFHNELVVRTAHSAATLLTLLVVSPQVTLAALSLFSTGGDRESI